jgi:hypothetical protein
MTTFIRHYVEMVIAMFVGMAVFGVAGMSALEDDAPAAALLVMATSMTVPMVAWMRHRRHGWAASMEMSAAMFVPTFAAIGLLAAGAVTDFHGLMMIQHVAMFPAMLLAMLLRRDEYTGHRHAVA